MRILGIETSCDDSSAAFLEVRRDRVVRLEQVVATQAIHAKYGGVVPEVAAREHSFTMPLVLDELTKKITGSQDGRKLGEQVDLIAVTAGPGLVTSLKVGIDTAVSLAAAWNKKIIGVNHIEGHIYSNLITGEQPKFPALVLVVSGGHTELLLMRDHGKYKLLGATRDDAAGEAFDKTAKLMGLSYPGGPQISKLAMNGNVAAYDFPRPMIRDPHFDFSFAGLKTAVRYFLRDNEAKLKDEQFKADVAASTEQAIVDVLVAKTIRAAKQSKVKTVMLAGGVAANRKLRETLAAAVAEKLPGVKFFEPSLKYCTDNAAMIALAGYYQAKRRNFDDYKKMDVKIGWELGRT